MKYRLSEIMGTKSCLWISIALLTLIIAGCNNRPATPKIELNVNYFDMGNIYPDKEKRSEIFYLKNTGGAPLKIISVSTSCGCTEAETESNEIVPGKQIQLTVTYDPSVHPGLVGRIKRIIYVQSNDPLREEIELELVGNMMPASKSGKEQI
ncbi:MAG: DUF1573 domain-containing protein [Chlamydiota bacterium]|nr:DUF1573 domain-containing protein [Chlamydiota bacterium]